MKKFLLMMNLVLVLNVSAQESPGFFGKRNTVGVSSSINIFNFSQYGNGSIIMPGIQYTRIRNNRRSYTFELSNFNVRVEGTSIGEYGSPYLFIPGPDKGGYNYDYAAISSGTGTVSGRGLSIYSVRNWGRLGQLGGYHSWGLHLTSIRYKSQNYKYNYWDEEFVYHDTFFNTTGRPKKNTLAISFSLGRKGMLSKSTNLVWDYGVRMRVPVMGIYSKDDFYDDRKFLVYNGARVFLFSTLFTVYAGLHFAL